MAPRIALPGLPCRDVIVYTAGILDGEGSIQINPSKGSAGKHYWCLTVQVSSSTPGFLEDLHTDWGGLGAVSFWHPRGSNRFRRSGNWRTYAIQAEFVLAAVLPYLRIKREQAEVALQFRKFSGFKKGTLTAEISAQRSRLALQIRELNARTGKGVIGRAVPSAL